MKTKSISSRPTLRATLAGIASLLFLTACAQAPLAAKPELKLPVSLDPTASHVQGGGQQNWQNWWQDWDDAVLNEMLQEALKNNQDLQLAAARVLEARANAGISQAGRYPTLDAQLSAGKTRSSEATGRLAPGANPISKDFLFSLNAAYEVDLWGKLAQADRAAGARLLAQEANRAALQTSLTASVVQTYVALRAADAQLALAESLLENRQQALRLQELRFERGLLNQAELNAGRADLLQAQSNQAQAKQVVANAESALALLLGRSPAHIHQPQLARGKTLEQLLAKARLPRELPADLLQRRADIIAAEQQLQASQADVAQARASYFPAIKLSTSLGSEARALGDLFNPGSMLWNVGAGLLQPLFRAGAIDAANDLAKARAQQASVQYVQVVQGAFRDTHDALKGWDMSAVQAQNQIKKRRLQEQNWKLAQLRFEKGQINGIDLAQARREWLQVQGQEVDAQRAQLAALIALYKAVGGGWA